MNQFLEKSILVNNCVDIIGDAWQYSLSKPSQLKGYSNKLITKDSSNEGCEGKKTIAVV